MMKDEITPILQKIMNSVLETNQIPETWKEASIILIPKENQDEKQIQNYRPISLLNIDYKIFSSILANRLKSTLSNWINADQAGFLPGRQIKDNTRIILNIIEHIQNTKLKKGALLLLDAEKAFDGLNWNFIIELLKNLRYGGKFINGIQAIYTEQSAKIKINGDMTEMFPIQRGVRQGCPLSPLLFILAIEILARKLRQDDDLIGIKVKNQKYKIKLFADDIILMSEDPQKEFPKMICLVNQFGSVAGLSINLRKTKILATKLSNKEKEELSQKTGIEIALQAKYLGINITMNNKDLYKNNYEKTWNKIKNDLKKWMNLDISLLGRIATIKMNILPRLCFLFQNIPIDIKEKEFTNWNAEFTKFIWRGKKPRIKMKNLQDTKQRGGLALPNLKLYREAAILIWLREWIHLDNQSLITLEGDSLKFGLHAYLIYGKVAEDSNFNKHPIRKTLMNTWNKYKKFFYRKLPQWTSIQEAFKQSGNSKGNKRWPTYAEILKKTQDNLQLKSLIEINQQGYNMNWFEYAQIHQQYQKDVHTGFEEEKTDLDKILQSRNKQLSKFYSLLLKLHTEDEYIKECMVKWAKNIGRSISIDEWEYLWRVKIKFFRSYSLLENFYKMFYQAYMTPVKLAKIQPQLKNTCWKCKQATGSFFHMWWTCKKAKNFWIKIHKTTEKILKLKIPMHPEIFLLGITDTSLLKPHDKLFTLMTTAARIVYARAWKLEETPEMEEWIVKVTEVAEMDILTGYLQSKDPSEFRKVWDPFKRFLEGKTISTWGFQI
uniref:Reverse transcriptase domain-containing protein n=1 Tax=Anolis carolinensis TaxID=28377 RepID=A0A803T1R0_ANOCA